jgi:phospholipase C
VQHVQHIIVVMQENHSFDNYFGALPYVPNGPYHAPTSAGACGSGDHSCVDGLTCQAGAGGALTCSNSNVDLAGKVIHAFHGTTRCVSPDLDHGWVATHLEMNYENPNNTLADILNDGFVRENQTVYPSGTPYATISYYDQTDLPFYYGLAETFAISDRHFAGLLGPTIPNRFYAMAATSFGHLTTDDTVPPAVGYKPITGTIFDLLDKAGVSWGDYFEDLGQASLFRPGDPHILPIADLLADLAGAPGTSLPQVVFVDPDFGLEGYALEDDEHPPTDIQRGQAHTSAIVNALRNGPYWDSSVLFITYDEHGGFYDHVRPPRAQYARTPDGIAPGQCADLSDPPDSEQRGGGAECSMNDLSTSDTDVLDAESLCPALTANPTGLYPASCATFDQMGVRVPFIAVSAFSRPHYVSHVARDHTSVLGFIEARFLTSGGVTQHLTARDAAAASLEDLFNFNTRPSLKAAVGSALPPSPKSDCTPPGSSGTGQL